MADRQEFLDLLSRQGYLDGMTSSRSSVAGSTRHEPLCCSFCLKDKDAVAKLVAGSGVYICNECVDLCHEIIGSQVVAEESARGFGAWSERPDDEHLASLARTQAVISQVDAALHEHVEVLRARGVTWTRIGEALGVSKQAAWERFSGED